jgi:hypothetical protein
MNFNNLINDFLKENSFNVDNKQNEIQKRFQELYDKFDSIPSNKKEAEKKGYVIVKQPNPNDIFFVNKKDNSKQMFIRKNTSYNFFEYRVSFKDHSANEGFVLLFFKDEKKNPIKDIRIIREYNDTIVRNNTPYTNVREIIKYSYDNGNYHQYWSVQTKELKTLEIYTNPFYWDDPTLKQKAEKNGMNIEPITGEEEF